MPQSRIILSGGEPLLHPNFINVCDTIRKLNGRITLSTNGVLIPKYIHIFHKNDAIQVSVDGNEKIHDYIRGEGSYQKAVKALNLLDENGINHGIGFTLNKLNMKCVDYIIDLCIETGSKTLNLNLYQPIRNKLEPVTFKKWLEVREYAIERAEKEGIYIPSSCIEKGCIAGVLGLSVLPDGTYWDCSRNQLVIGKYPQKIKDVLFWDNIVNNKPRNQFETCCRRLEYG